MAWVAVNIDGSENIFEEKPTCYNGYWTINDMAYDIEHDIIRLPKGTIEKILGYKLSDIHTTIKI